MNTGTTHELSVRRLKIALLFECFGRCWQATTISIREKIKTKMLQCDDHPKNYKCKYTIQSIEIDSSIRRKMIMAIWRSIDLLFNNENRKYSPSLVERID